MGGKVGEEFYSATIPQGMLKLGKKEVVFAEGHKVTDDIKLMGKTQNMMHKYQNDTRG